MSVWGAEIYKNEGAVGESGGVTASGNINSTASNGNPAPAFGNTSAGNKTFIFSGFDVSDYTDLSLSIDAAFKNFPSTTNTWPYATITFYKNDVAVKVDDTTIKWSSKVNTYSTYVIDDNIPDFDKIVIEGSPALGKSGSGKNATNYGMYLDNIILSGTLISGGTPDPVLESITVDGDLSTKEYEEGTDIDFTGLTATGHYDNETTANLTSSVAWSFSPALTAGLTSVTVTATKDAISGNKVINGLTVNEHVVTPGEYEIPTNNTLWGTSYSGAATGATILTGSKNDVTITINKNTGSGMYVNDAQTRIYNGYTMVFSVPSGYVITAIQFTADGGNWAGEHTADVGTMTDNKNWSGSSNTVTISIAGTCRMTGVTVTFEAEAADAPSVTINPTEVNATAEAVNGSIDVTYTNITTASATVGLFNDAECNETFTDGWLTASLNGDKDIAYSISANNAFEVRTAYIKLTAPASNGTSPNVVKIIAVNQAAKEYVFASLAELLENVTPTTTAKNVTVTLTDEVIVGFAKSGSYTNGVKFNVTYGSPSTTKEIEIYFHDVPSEWQIGGKISGTLTNCPWQTFSGTWELAPASGWAWSNLTYTAPKAISSVVVTGAPTKTTYVDGEKFDPAGLTVTVNYTDDTHEVIDASMATWAYNPSQVLAKDQTSVGVQATYNEVQSVEYTVSGLTVGEIPTKTVAEFIAAEGMRCYLVGTVSDIEIGTKLKYGNFNLTDASGTIYVYGCLDTEGNAEQFGSLDVEDGDKIKVIAETYKYYGSKDEAVNVQFVQEINVAKISIDNMSMEFGDVATINATITPAVAATAVTYAIKAGSDDCITLEGDQVTAKSVAGTATIVATISDAPEYDGAVKEFTVTVTAPDTRKKAQDIDGFEAISGNLNEDISYVSSKGDGTTDPKTDGGSILYYQPGSGKSSGGYMTLQAVKGCTIDQVKIITASNNATSIAYSAGEGSLSSSTEVEAGGEYLTPALLNAEVVNIYCTGSDKYHRLYIAQVIVYYTGEPASVHHLTLSGTYPTEFEQGDVFDYTGLVVTAAYDAEETDTEDVTSAANVSTPDMNVAGVKTITVSYGEKSVEYTITVNAAAGADDLSGVWQLITNATVLEEGMKVIIAQHVETDGPIYTIGDQKNNNRGAVESAVAGSILTPNFKTRVFELEDAGSGMFALKAVEDSKYLYAAASGNNYMKSQESIDDNAKWTITVDADGVASIVATNSSNRNVMQFNSGSSLFSCYGSASQTAIALYTRAKEERAGFTVGKLATVCVPYAVAQEDIIGADVYEIAGKNEAGKIVFDQVVAGGMEAGVAYLVQAKAETATFYYSGDAVTEPQNEGKALKGTFSGIDIAAADAANVYFFKDNALWSAKETGVKILANRAWLDMGAVTPVSGSTPAPGRRRITMDVHGENAATGMDELNASEAPRKMIIDGQLYILRGEKMYNANGTLVK